MRRLLAVMTVALVTAIPAGAQDIGGGLAAGYNQDVQGISLRYMPGRIGFEGALGFSVSSPDDDNLDSAVDLNLGGAVILPISTMSRIRLNGLAGFMMFLDQSENPNVDSETDLVFFAGVEPEFFVLDNFSISTQMGVQIYIDDEPNDNGGFYFETFGPRNDLFQGLSIRYYF